MLYQILFLQTNLFKKFYITIHVYLQFKINIIINRKIYVINVLFDMKYFF